MGNLRSSGNDAERRKMATGQHFIGVLDRFSKDPQYRQSQEEHGWDEAKFEKMDKLAQEDHSYTLTRSEFLRYSSMWTIQHNSSGPNKPIAIRPDYRAEVQLKNQLYQKSGECQKPIPPQDQDRVRENNELSDSYRSGARIDKKTGWRFWKASSSWWQSSQWNRDEHY